MSLVNLPLYEGFNTFALWPSMDIVRGHFFCLTTVFILLFVKVSSCYGLFSSESILSPEATGGMVTLPFYPGYKYVGYASKNIEEV